MRSLASDSWRRAEGLIDPAPSGRTTPCPRPTSPVPGNVGSRGEWMTDSRTRSACPASRSAPWRTRPPRTWFVPDIPSSRLHQLGVHGAALKAVRPRLRLRALRLDRVAAHTPAQTRPGPPKKRTPLTPSSYLTDPAPSWMTPRQMVDVARTSRVHRLCDATQRVRIQPRPQLNGHGRAMETDSLKGPDRPPEGVVAESARVALRHSTCLLR